MPKRSTFRGVAGEQRGAPTRPEGEGGSGHDRSGGGRKSAALTNSDPNGGPPDASSGDASGSGLAERRITRATMRFRIYPSLHPEPKRLVGELHELKKHAVHAANAALRAHYRADTDALDEYLKTYGEPPRRGRDLPMQKINVYQTLKQIAPVIPGAHLSAIQQDVYKYWRRWRWETIVMCKRRPPQYSDTRPIPLRAAECRVQPYGEHWCVDVPFWAGPGNRRQLPIKARDSAQEEVLNKIAEGEYKRGNAQVEWDERKRRFYLKLTYTRAVPVVHPDHRTAAVQRGIRQFLVAVTRDGQEWIDHGHDIVEHRRATAARRRQIQSSVRIGRRKGRGRRRALSPLRKLEEKTERWRDTRTQKEARHVVFWLRGRGVTTIFIEDFRGIRDYCEEQLGYRIAPYVHDWRYDDLQRRIVACAEEEGMHVVQVEPEWISRTCPNCEGSVEPDLKRWKIKCARCRYERDMDVAAAANLRVRGERFGGEVLVGAKSLQKSTESESAKWTARKSKRRGPKSRNSWHGDGTG